MRKIVLTCLLVFFACYGQEVLACSCIPPPGEPTYVWHKDMLKTYASDPAFASDTIFLGTVSNIDRKRATEEFHPEATISVTFSIEKVWADSRTDPNTDRTVITIQTNESSGMCGVNFREGVRYFVFAKQLRTSLCTPTSYYRDEGVAADYFTFLGEGRKPEKPKGTGKSEKPTSAERPPRGVV